MVKIVDPYFLAELGLLRAKLTIVQRRMAIAFPSDGLLEGRNLGRLLAAHKKESAIIQQIKELCGRRHGS
jgi:hypothetical protein